MSTTREDLERDGDSLFDAKVQAEQVRDQVYAFQTSIDGLVLDDTELNEAEGRAELAGQLQAMAELAGDVLATLETLEQEATRRMGDLTDEDKES